MSEEKMETCLHCGFPRSTHTRAGLCRHPMENYEPDDRPALRARIAELEGLRSSRTWANTAFADEAVCYCHLAALAAAERRGMERALRCGICGEECSIVCGSDDCVAAQPSPAEPAHAPVADEAWALLGEMDRAEKPLPILRAALAAAEKRGTVEGLRTAVAQTIGATSVAKVTARIREKLRALATEPKETE